MAGKRPNGVRSALQVVCIIVLALLLIGILSGEIARTALALRRDTATVTTLGQGIAATGYIFRDEVLVSSVDGGPIAYATADGCAVKTGAELATVYADGSNSGTRLRAAEITAEIEHLRSLDDPVLPDFYGSYEKLMSALSRGDVLSTADACEVLDAALDRICAMDEQQSEREAKIAALQAEFDALIENDRNASDRVNAPCDGVFYRTVDGYETVLTVDAVETLTPGGLRALLASPQSTTQAVGKVVLDGAWYLAVPLLQEQAARFKVQQSYEVRMGRTGERMTLMLSRISDADTSGEVLLIFCAENIPLPSDLARTAEIEIATEAVSGIWVPTVALREEGGERFVFVDVDGVAEKRKVNLLFAENGRCLAEAVASSEFLQEGERILVTPRHIYEGKTLK